MLHGEILQNNAPYNQQASRLNADGGDLLIVVAECDCPKSGQPTAQPLGLVSAPASRLWGRRASQKCPLVLSHRYFCRTVCLQERRAGCLSLSILFALRVVSFCRCSASLLLPNCPLKSLFCKNSLTPSKIRANALLLGVCRALLHSTEAVQKRCLRCTQCHHTVLPPCTSTANSVGASLSP